jgi:hypothetical protein
MAFSCMAALWSHRPKDIKGLLTSKEKKITRKKCAGSDTAKLYLGISFEEESREQIYMCVCVCVCVCTYMYVQNYQSHCLFIFWQ